MDDIQKQIFLMIFSKYNKVMFSRKETSTLINVSIGELDKMKEDGLGPGYKKKDTPGGKGAVQYPLQSIVKYLTLDNIKTA